MTTHKVPNRLAQEITVPAAKRTQSSEPVPLGDETFTKAWVPLGKLIIASIFSKSGSLFGQSKPIYYFNMSLFVRK
ncbi:hypothetical protein [Paenibacillus monticola]|uniref:hypothetical protein n=1 Tax=Paenibacillus monticola TaxID=2666075 RepID=UPI001E517F9E|nr:hypothetical protein [Paenibacillus monticola]